MSERTTARRYTEALLGLADDANIIDRIDDELTGLEEELAEGGKELFSVLCSPVFDQTERRAALDAVLPGLKLHELTTNFLRLLLERDRFALLPLIAATYRERVHERAGRVRVQVSTVEPLTPQLEEEVRAAFAKATGREVILDASIDPSLIGGMVARIGGRVYDASIRRRLEDIKHRLINASATPEA